MQEAWSKWFHFFPKFQCALRTDDGKLAATVHAVPLKWTAPFEMLPDGMEMYESGWDWVIE